MSSTVDVNGSLTPSEGCVLDVLADAARPLPMRAIAEKTMLPKGTVRRALCELKREGWIVARVNPLDPRGISIKSSSNFGEDVGNVKYPPRV